MHLTPHYPTFSEFVIASKSVIDRVRGENSDNEEAAQAGWIVVGYATSLGFSFVAHSAGPQLSDDALCEHLEAARGQHATGADPQKAIPWGEIALTVLQLILAWRKR